MIRTQGGATLKTAHPSPCSVAAALKYYFAPPFELCIQIILLVFAIVTTKSRGLSLDSSLVVRTTFGHISHRHGIGALSFLVLEVGSIPNILDHMDGSTRFERRTILRQPACGSAFTNRNIVHSQYLAESARVCYYDRFVMDYSFRILFDNEYSRPTSQLSKSCSNLERRLTLA